MRRAFLFTILTILAILGVLFYGLPSVARFAAFLSDLRKSSLPVDRNDTTPPAPPRLDRLPEATKEPEIEISGVTEEGATVILTLNGKDEEVVADADGKFRFSYSLRKGENQILAKAKDRTGNESQPTAGITVLFDNEAPKLDISAPADGSQFYGDGQRQLAIKGTTEVGITLTINDRIVKVEEDGTFTFATTLADGENSFNLKSADKAGNQTEKTLKVNFSP
ncbi:hypothetical protein A2376_02920 [Candidatus Woesebacteria bacterium RIFOXYB1_FULL_47_31]|uniref:Bacterial Ig domain-containing protein n=1 Tax=Candidatus Woesebacteria bacterium RIFOXYB1_FULL_47_31 TaxID=1802542 RepID=A0A1F8D456_9BACT|nr:MAG: hypothetical protein A2376_02920 [Candidatus Woesebacteria bacterium RIFOXYB1_FULL_47_31]